MFSAQAEAVGAGETSIRRSAYNVAVSLEDELPGLPTTIRVSRNGRLFERSFDFGLNASVLWSPDASRFAITGSGGSATGRFRTAVVSLSDDTLGWLELTRSIEQAFAQPARCDHPQAPDVGAITWWSNRRLVVAAQMADHATCDGSSTFGAYEVDAVTGHVEHSYERVEARRRWGSLLGTKLQAD